MKDDVPKNKHDRVSQGEDMQHLQIGSLTDRGLNPQRDKNEDFLGQFEGEYGTLLVICDGMGGYEGGEIASRLAVEAVKEYFDSYFIPGEESAIIEQSIDIAQKKISERAQTDPELAEMGTTIVLLLLRSGNFWYAHTGDSRLYLKRGESLNQLTRDHSMVQDLVEAGDLTPEQAREHPERSVVTRVLGHTAYKPDVSGPHIVQQDDVFLLCSDGLTEYLRDDELSEHLNEEPQIACHNMVELAKNRGGMDNITLQIVHVMHSQKITVMEAVPEPSRKALPSFTIVVTVLIFLGAVVWYALSLRADGKPKAPKPKREKQEKAESQPVTARQEQPAVSLASIEAALDNRLEQYAVEGGNKVYLDLFNSIRSPNQAKRLKFISNPEDKTLVFIVPGEVVYVAKNALEDKNSYNMNRENIEALITLALVLSENKSAVGGLTAENWNQKFFAAGTASLPDKAYESAIALYRKHRPNDDGLMFSVRFKNKFNPLIKVGDFNLTIEAPKK
jgi:protein phosphatase